MSRVRQYRPDDLEGVIRVERLAFAEEPLPAPVFVQYHELAPRTFLVAEADSRIVGYLLAARSADDPTEAVILSMGVAPENQGKGIGHALLHKALRALADVGAHEVELTVSPDNERAIRLYRSLGFKKAGGLAENLFGPGEHRVRMAQEIEGTCSAKSDHLLAEASASLAFTNLLVAVSGAGLAGLIAVRSTNPVAYWYVIVALLGSLYSSMFYANVSGIVARLAGTRNPTRPLIIGNTLSEYMGVYPAVLVFPLLVLSLTGSAVAAGIGALANGLAFALYQLSDFGILGRQSPRWWCVATLVSVVGTSVAHLVLQVTGPPAIQYALAALASFILMGLTVRGVRAVEH